jgi:hypothetical protein
MNQRDKARGMCADNGYKMGGLTRRPSGGGHRSRRVPAAMPAPMDPSMQPPGATADPTQVPALPQSLSTAPPGMKRGGKC